MLKTSPIRTPQETWARTNAEYLLDVFQRHLPESENEVEETLIQLLEAPYQLKPPIKRLTSAAVQKFITSLYPKKASGHDLITGKILNELLPTGIKYLTQLFSVILLTEYFPSQWKVTQVILILKPGKPPNELTSYRPISLLPIVSQVFEKLIKIKTTRYGPK
jgi:hypothetical protein